MQCNSCGSINPSTANNCTFCGSKLQGGGASGGSSSGGGSSINLSFFQDAFNLLKELNDLPSERIKWWSFFFPVAYLAGYDAQRVAQQIAFLIIIPAIVIKIVFVHNWAILFRLSAIMLVWQCYMGFLVGTRHTKLIKAKTQFNMGNAVMYQIIFIIAYSLITGL